MGARAFVSRLSWGLCLLSYGVVYAAPEGFHLVSGEAAPQPSAVQGEMVVGSHGRAIIEWGKFSIGAGERVHFDQHGINPAVLNRVIGSDPSHILGQLSSNGEVFLINRQGVIFGAHARVETAGFIAASLDVLNEDFLHAHNLLFSGTGRGSIVNMGTIECPRGNIALIGSMVENTGALRAPEGFVALGVGSEVLLQPEGMPHLLIKTALEPEGEEALINHEGLIEALRVELKSGTSVFTKAIQNSGSIDALVFEERGGEVFLVAEGGQCILEGARITAADGGMVQVLGTEVQLLGDTMIDASGKEGGGEVLIGGDNRGENPDVFNADWTSVGPDVVVKADALERGDGGKVIYWGNRGTRYWGSTSVKGAVGGFVEVSGAWFEYEGHIAGAKDVLFDPADITISTGTQTGGMFSGGVWTSTSTPATINRTNIQNLLNTPTNVLIDTSTTSPALTGQGDILISSNITWGTTATLTLIADANIRVVATVQSTNGAASTGVPVINFQAKGDSTSSPFSGILLDTGTVIRSATQSIFLQGRGSTIAGQNDMPGIVLQGSATIQTDTGTITLIGQGGGVNTVSTTRNYGVYNQGQTITATGAGNIIIHATGGAGTGGANHGFLMDGGTLSTGAGGTIEIVGIAGVGGNTNKGISFSTASATITATQITMEGIGGNTTANDYGIEITGGLTFGDGTITNQITMTGTNIGTGSNQYGVQINGATLQVNNGGTIGITGIGGGFYLNSNGGSNYGVNVTGTNVVTLGSVGGTGLNTINMTGIGGSGTAGTHIGVNIDTSFTMNMNGTNPNNSFNFINCAGGNGSSGSNYGVQLQTGFTHQGNLTFQNCTGGSGGQNNYGVFFTATSSTIAASNILATDCFGGAGTGNDYGIYVINATTLGTTTTASISMNGGSLGTGSNEIGIFVTGDGRLTVGDNGTINLVGTGGGFYNGAGTNNHGVSLFSMRFFLGVPGGSKPATINITGIGGSGSQGSHCGVDVAPFLSMNISGTNQNISFNFLNCLGGHGTGGGNSGVQMSGLIVTFPGFLTFQNCVGGSGGQNNHGVFFTTSMEFISASNIIATDCLGGPGTGNDIGFFVSVGRLGDTTAERISISAGSLGTGSNEVGIQLNPANAIVVGNGGTINLVGTGGGFYNGGGSSNHGVFFNTGSTIAAGVGGSAGLNTISITGLGGSGSGGNHMGVYYTGAGITLNGTNPANALNFINCVGGSGSGGNNSGMQFAANFSVGNSWMLENITGGSGGKSNHGVFVNGVTVAGTNITAVDCTGGPGVGSNIGFYVHGGALGSIAIPTRRISISANTLGTDSNEVGILVDNSGAITAGDNGTINLVGVGGGFYNGAGANNYGVSFSTATLNAGAGGSSLLNTINVTGIGGSGTPGSHAGVNIDTSFTVNLLGTNPNNSLNFLNCVGGNGSGGTNSGVQCKIGFTQAGNLTFQNCTGGSGGQSNHGVFLTTGVTTIVAPNITAVDCFGGPGTGSDVGYFVSVGQLGDTTTESIAISAGSLGTGSNEVGIQLNPANAIVVGNGGTINLVGTGGGFYSGGGSSNHGVFFNTGSTIAAGAGGSAGLNTISITGLGGSGSGGNHMGVYYTGAGITLNGTNPANALNFINCVGGSGSGGNNSGVQFAANFSVGNSWTLENITGGSGGKSNHGVFVNGVTVAGTNITAVDCTGGPGVGSNIGFYVHGGALGSIAIPTRRISISANTLGTDSNEVGILVDNSGAITVGDNGTINLVGVGGGFYSGAGANNYGVSFSTATLNAGAGGSSLLNTINVTGIGGAGAGGHHAGVNIDTSFAVNLLGTNLNNSLNFLNCVGGSGGGSTGQYGVYIQTGFTFQGNLTFQNCVGSSGTQNHGVFLTGIFTVAASTITAVDCLSGPGVGSDFGFYIHQATLGTTATGRVSISAGSLGTGSNEIGIVVDGSGAITAGDGATMQLIGSGGGAYNGSGSNNYGVDFNTGTLNIGTAGAGLNTIDITGLGGVGSGGHHDGVLCAGMTVNINGTNPSNSLNFNNCLGGQGSTGLNNGVHFTQSLATGTAALNFSNCTGGGGGGSNHGVFLDGASAVISGANINALDCMGGPGSGTNIGFYVSSGTVGDPATANNITVLAGSLGTGTGEVGIQIDGTGLIRAKGAGTITLQGAGGGTGADCYGIFLNNTGAVAGTTGAVSLTGIPGSQSTIGIRLNAGTNVSAVAGNIALTTLENSTITIVGGGGTSVDTTGSGNINFNGPLVLSTAAVTTSSASGNIAFNSTIDGSAIGLTATATAGTLTFVGKVGSLAGIGTLAATGTTITIDSNISTQGAGATGSMTFSGPVSIGGGVALDSTANASAGGNMTFTSTIDSIAGLAQNLTIIAGTGTLIVNGAVGATHNLGSLLQTSGASSTFGSTIATSEPGGINITASAISFGGNISLTGRGSFEANGPVTLAVSPISVDTTVGGSAGYILFNSTVNGASATTLTAGSENITLVGLVGNTIPLTSLTATGSTITQEALVRTTGNVTYTGSAQVNLSSGITTTTGGNVSVTGPTILDTAVTVNTSALNGNIEFHSVVDGAQTLTLTAGTGTVSLDEAIGSQTPLTSLSATGSTITQSSSVAVSGAGGVSYTGSTSLGGNITSTSAAATVIVTGAATLTGAVAINTNNGIIHFTSTVNGTAPATQDFTLNSGTANIFLDGNIGAGVSVGALTVTTSAGSLTIPGIIDAKSAAFNTPVLLAGGTVITTSAGNISFSSTVQGAGDSLVLNVTGGVVTFGGNVGLGGGRLSSVRVNGATQLTGNTTIFTDVGANSLFFNGTVDGDFALTVNSLGTVTFAGLVGGVTPIGSLIFSAAASTLSTNIYTNNSVIDLTAVPLTLGANVFISTQNAQTGGSPGTGANILLGTVTGAAFNLTLNSGTGDITFGNTVSGVGALTISRAANVNVNSTISAASITQTLGTGTTAVSSAITATTGDITINTNILNFTAVPTSATTTLGSMNLTHTGTMHVKGAMNAHTNFTENGGGALSLGDADGQINATTGTVTLNSPVVFVADPVITGTDIVINTPIDGAFPFTLTATHTVTFTSTGVVGSTTPISSLTVTGPTGIFIGANQTVAGNIVYNNAITLTQSVDFVTSSSGTFHVAGAATTSGNDLAVTSAGTLTFDGAINATATLGGNVTLVSTGGDVIVNSINTSTTGGGTAGSIILQPASGSHASGFGGGTVAPDGLIQFLGSNPVTLSATGGSLGTNGLIALAPLGRATQQSVATIVSSSTPGSDLVFNAGTFIMGTNEAMTSLGSVTLNTTGYTALSDIVALNNITLPCPGGAGSGYLPSNFIVSRPPALLVTNDPPGTQISANSHVLAGALFTIGCAGSITPDCATAGETRNVGIVAGGLVAAQLVRSGVILNFDNESSPPPIPPLPPPICPGPPLPNRAANISDLARADAQLEDLLPIFWGRLHIERIPKICPIECLEECSEPVLRFLSFNFDNDVR